MKKFLAMAMTGVMVLSSGIIVNADNGVTGAGVVEYDNSEAVAYDKVTVPTVATTASNYAFTLDPNGLLHTYDPTNYDAGSVYFSKIKDRATIKAADNVTLYTEAKSKVPQADWGTVITVSNKAITAIVGDCYVWVPDTTATVQSSGFTSGKPGKYVKLTTDNVGNYFELDSDETGVQRKADYKSGTNVFDGEIYKSTYTAVTGVITDSDVTPLTEEYVTLDDSGTVTAVKNLYTSNTGTAATKDDVVYTAATTQNAGSTNTATVVNKSTKAKTVKAVVTMKNVGGIKFKATNSYTDDTDASMYVVAKNTAQTPVTAVLSKASDTADTATATYTTELAAASGVSEVTYMSGENDKTGGHSYQRYAAADPTYTSDSFYIEATANTGAATAWDEWAAKVTDETRPEINIVYTVTDKTTEPTITGSATMTKSDNAEFTLSGLGELTVKSVVLKNCHNGAGDVLSPVTLKSASYSLANSKLVLDCTASDFTYRFTNESAAVDVEVTLSDDTVLTSELTFVNS